MIRKRQADMLIEIALCLAVFSLFLVVVYAKAQKRQQNQPPVVDAGPDQTVTLGADGTATVQLRGAVVDDGVPPGRSFEQLQRQNELLRQRLEAIRELIAAPLEESP